VHNLNNNIKQWNVCFITDMNFKHFQISSKEFIINDQKQIYDFQTLNIITQKHENNYIERIHAKYIFRFS
jgi:hypothetical protein